MALAQRIWPVRRAEFERGGRPAVAVEVSDGRVEIYAVVDGLEMFAGYASDARIPAPVRMGAIEALVEAPWFPGEGWRASAGGRP